MSMFTAECCATCKHTSLLKDEDISTRNRQQWICGYHNKLLPSKLPIWQERLHICQAWHRYSDPKPHSDPSYSWLLKIYPDAGLLYNYKDEYTPGTTVLMKIEDLPDYQP